MARTKKRIGIGAECSVLVKFLHPRKKVVAQMPNAGHHERLSGLLSIRREMKQVNQKKQMCIVFRHDSFPDQELHAVTRYAKVDKEGAEEHLA